ncbi:hypothetical protein DAEQUDRAFT_729898 [Daedalea quercina L-15889]|uniref:Uncharacterized protein n=1 Tax=Daedalea quercina L-15889 TaxID=1314783 RepID=A0A165NBJ0_9APHY|nr:hypothetical protein DAEQUDRAFT_729898 [Daedalea quercina L-15889]
MNLADMILDLTQTVNGGSLSYIGAYNPFPLLIPSITSVIITRFTLDLRKRALGVESSEHSGPMTTLRFSRASESSAVRSPPAGSNSECLTADIRTPPSGGGGGFTPTASHSNDIERADCTGDVDTPPPSSHEVVDARLATMDA